MNVATNGKNRRATSERQIQLRYPSHLEERDDLTALTYVNTWKADLLGSPFRCSRKRTIGSAGFPSRRMNLLIKLSFVSHAPKDELRQILRLSERVSTRLVSHVPVSVRTHSSTMPLGFDANVRIGVTPLHSKRSSALNNRC